jgi:hypothetical protein
LDTEVKNTGAVFLINMVNIAELVEFSGKEPIIFTSYEPGGLYLETKIVPLVESTPIRSIA